MENEMQEMQEMQEQQEQNNAQDYLDQLAALRKNTVSRDSYDQLRAENKQLIEALATGTTKNPAGEDTEDDRPTLDELRKDLFTKKHDNIGYYKLVKEIRNRCLSGEDGDPYDPFVAVNENGEAPKQEAYIVAQQIIDVMDDCLEKSNGRNSLFNANICDAFIESPNFDRVNKK